MCTKSKEECEKHYMKHFINNPLFASTLLNLKQAEEAQHNETAIPFHCEYPCPALTGSFPARSLLCQGWDQQLWEGRAPQMLLAFIPKGITYSDDWLGECQEQGSLHTGLIPGCITQTRLPVPWEETAAWSDTNIRVSKAEVPAQPEDTEINPAGAWMFVPTGLQSTPELLHVCPSG